MAFRNKVYVTIFGILEFIALLFFLSIVAARAGEASDNAQRTENGYGTGAARYQARLF